MKDNNQQESKSMEAQASESVTSMTAMEFHRLLAENTKRQNALRLRREAKLAELKEVRDKTLDMVMQGEKSTRRALRAARAEYEGAKEAHNVALRQYAKTRTSANVAYDRGRAVVTNDFSVANEQLQMERHNIFERFRDSGGQPTDDMAGLLHPAWKKKKDKATDTDTDEMP